MLKRIALTAVFVATAAFVGVSVAKAHSGTAPRTGAPTTRAPQGFPCVPGACITIATPVPPQGLCMPGGGCR
jgi:hypothetical protein